MVTFLHCFIAKLCEILILTIYNTPKLIFISFSGWIGQNKAVCALSVLLFAFFISTIALAVQKNNLAAELETCGVTTPPPTSPPESFKVEY